MRRPDFGVAPSAVIVAFTTLIALLEAEGLGENVMYTCRPRQQARTGPPAITPVPGAAGLSMTREAPYLAVMSCGMVVPARGTRTRALRAFSPPLRNRFRHFARFADTDSNMTGTVANHHHCVEAKCASPTHNLCDTVDVHEALFKIQ